MKHIGQGQDAEKPSLFNHKQPAVPTALHSCKCLQCIQMWRDNDLRRAGAHDISDAALSGVGGRKIADILGHDAADELAVAQHRESL